MPPMLYLIDGHALAYRTYFALNPSGGSDPRWQTSKGEPTAGTYGFISVLLRLIETEKPDYLAVAFDTGKTFRDEIYTEYKGTREKMPDDLRSQINRIRQIVDAFNIPRLELDHYEADDVLGTIAKQAEEKGLGVKIITGDRDLLQLVTERIIVNLPGAKLSEARDFHPQMVKEYLGVRPDQVVDYKAMVGDKSDNIPGVAGIGEKTATSLLETYGTLDEIYANLEKLSPGVRKKLEQDKEWAYKSQDLARIRVDAPILLDLEKAKTGGYDLVEVEKIFRELEFKALMTRISNLAKLQTPARPEQQLNLFEEKITALGVTPQEPAYKIDVKVVQDMKDLSDLTAVINKSGWVAIDTETTSTDPMRADLVGISLAVQVGQGYYIPVGHKNTDEPQLPLDSVISVLTPIFSGNSVKFAGHNIKYDALVLERAGLPIHNISFDTMIAEFLVNPSSRNLGLKNLAWVRMGAEMTHIEELIGKGKEQLNMAEVRVADVAPYAAADAEVVFRLLPIMQEELEKVAAAKLMQDLEMPLVSVLADMEEAGIMVDVKFFNHFAAELGNRIHDLEINTQEAAGVNFNLNSTQQLSRILFEVLKLSPPDRGKKTTSGNYSTSADVLEELRGQHPVVDMILEYRELSKLKSTYIDALPLQVNPKTGRIHTSYNQTGSVTGRIASSDPNLQNIPTRTELGRRVRQGFVAAPDMVLLSVDYSQIELRIVAHMAQDHAMLDAFRADEDIHAATASAIYNTPLEQVTKDQRRRAKAINFGLIYGMGAYGLSRAADLTVQEANKFIEAYFTQFPGVKSYLDGIRKLAATRGYVETLLGRRRYFPGLATQSNPNQRQREEREAINAPIQGTAADIIKLAMLKIPGALKSAGLKGRMLLQVHDELLLECPTAELEATARLIQKEMGAAYQLDIPLKTEARSGKNWGQMVVLEEK